VLPDDNVLHRNMSKLFSVNFNANLKLFLRLSNCASVGEKNCDDTIYNSQCLLVSASIRAIIRPDIIQN
jgi:hypothetical protein